MLRIEADAFICKNYTSVDRHIMPDYCCRRKEGFLFFDLTKIFLSVTIGSGGVVMQESADQYILRMLDEAEIWEAESDVKYVDALSFFAALKEKFEDA